VSPSSCSSQDECFNSSPTQEPTPEPTPEITSGTFTSEILETAPVMIPTSTAPEPDTVVIDQPTTVFLLTTTINLEPSAEPVIGSSVFLPSQRVVVVTSTVSADPPLMLSPVVVCWALQKLK
jgi:hypothetical protein